MTYLDDSINYQQIESPIFQDSIQIQPISTGTFDSIHKRMLLILSAAILMGLLFLAVKPKSAISSANETAVAVESLSIDENQGGSGEVQAFGESNLESVTGILSPVFSPEVRYWETKIIEWANRAGVDPTLAAIIMQVESCGDPHAVSGAGAQGLFQVMPFHFEPSEDSLDPDTNAYRGLSYFAGRMEQTHGDIGRSFAGYNGGHVAADSSWDYWANETQRYYTWTTGIYADIQAGLAESPTLQQWMQAGGAGLCQQAANRLGI